MVHIHAFRDARTAIWPGGETTEMFIYPGSAQYADRDFDFRISTATIEVETSEFTSLPAYNRLLAVLEGKLELVHEGHYSRQLDVFESDRFHGSWKTLSTGKARDFNVIYSDRYRLDFELFSLAEPAEVRKTQDFLFLFMLKDGVYCKYDLVEVEDSIRMDRGEVYFSIGLERL